MCVCVYAGVLLAYSMCSTVDASTASSCTVQLDTTRHTDLPLSPHFFRLFSFASHLSSTYVAPPSSQ